MVDFSAMLSGDDESDPIEPRELHSQLKKAPGYGYLRDVQGQVLTAWHLRREERDVVIKVNTGGGKTIDGLIILQSYINAGAGPALYVAPTKYPVNQVVAEATKLGIETTTNVDGGAYLNSEAIGVINAYELVNGRTKFSKNRPTRPRAPIGAVVIDDAHAAIATTRTQLALTVPRKNPAFTSLLELFADDLKTQSSDSYMDVRDDRRGSPVRVPFWAWRSKVEQAREILRTQTAEKQALYWQWPAVREVLPLCRVVFSNHELTITPLCPPIDHVTSFMEAKHRVFLTATLADDSVLVTDFGADPESVFADVGVASDLLADPDNVVASQLLGELIERCATVTGCEHFGLIIGRDAPLSSLGLLGELLPHCADVGTALVHLQDFFHLHDRGAMPTITVDGDIATFGYTPLASPVKGAEQFHDGSLAVGQNIMRALLGPSWKARALLLSRRRPVNPRPYQQVFQCPIEFDAEHSMLVFAASDLARPVAGADPDRCKILKERLEGIRGQHDLDVLARVRRTIQALVVLRRCSLDQLAATLAMNRRRVNRLLEREGSSYRELLDDVRCRLALRLIGDTDLSLGQIAAALDYSAASAFTHAFRRWTNVSPLEWRRRHGHPLDKI